MDYDNFTEQDIGTMAREDIHIFLDYYQIKNEQGILIDFKNHAFLWDMYADMSPQQVCTKAAQVGATTKDIIKTLWIAWAKGRDIIYILPTAGDVNQFAGGKVNRIIANNPIFQRLTKDKDSVEQKQVGENIIYYRGSWTQKAAIMVSSDLNIYDEIDSCKPDVIEQYSTRLQHSKYRWEWTFSHPSSQGTGVDKKWILSDQKHWFIKCSHCKKKQYLSWPESIDENREMFVCKYCKGEIYDDDRRKGEWVAKYKGREISGYWVPLLICPWVSAKQILSYKNDKSEEYFYNKVLGLPYVGGGNKLTKAHLMQNLTSAIIVPQQNERVVIGVDTGNNVHYVVGCQKGLFYYSEFSKGELNSNIDKYEEICDLMKRWPRAIVVIDQGGDITGSRALREKYPGRVFLCSFSEDRKTKELARWGARDEDGAVIADRNRCIQLVVDEFSDGRIPLQGTEDEWYHYWLHWNALTRIKEFDQTTMEIKRKVWVRSGDDHWAISTVYWRIGMMKFAGTGSITNTVLKPTPNSYEILPNDTVQIDMKKLIEKQINEERDWRE